MSKKGAAKLDTDARFYPQKHPSEHFKEVTTSTTTSNQCNRGNTLGVSMILAGDKLFNHCVSYKKLQYEQIHKNHWWGPSMKGAFCISYHDHLCPVPLFEELDICWILLHPNWELTSNERWLVHFKKFKDWATETDNFIFNIPCWNISEYCKVLSQPSINSWKEL